MNNKIKQFVAFGICSVVALALCLGVLVVTVNNMGEETNKTENKTIINKTELDSSNETLVKYINKLVSATDDRFVKTNTFTDVSISDIKVLTASDTQSKDEALLNFAKDRMHSVIDSYYDKDLSGTFEKDDSKKISFKINKNALKFAGFTIGQVNENGESVFDNEGNPVDNEYYYLTYNADFENKSFNKKFTEMFSVKDDISAREQFIDAVKDNCKINNFEAKPDTFTITAKVNRGNDEIQYINVIRNYAVTVDATFINDAEFFGEKKISFLYTVTDTYEYSYAGISFVEDEVTVNVGEEYMLNVNAVIDDDSEYKVTFTSSDENIVTIDEMGYVKCLKNCDMPVIITVKLNYLGETFTDTCKVNVSEE